MISIEVGSLVNQQAISPVLYHHENDSEPFFNDGKPTMAMCPILSQFEPVLATWEILSCSINRGHSRPTLCTGWKTLMKMMGEVGHLLVGTKALNRGAGRGR